MKRTVKSSQLSFEADDMAGSGDEQADDNSASDDEKMRKRRCRKTDFHTFSYSLIRFLGSVSFSARFGKDPTAKTDFLRPPRPRKASCARSAAGTMRIVRPICFGRRRSS